MCGLVLFPTRAVWGVWLRDLLAYCPATLAEKETRHVTTEGEKAMYCVIPGVAGDSGPSVASSSPPSSFFADPNTYIINDKTVEPLSKET